MRFALALLFLCSCAATGEAIGSGVERILPGEFSLGVVQNPFEFDGPSHEASTDWLLEAKMVWHPRARHMIIDRMPPQVQIPYDEYVPPVEEPHPWALWVDEPITAGLPPPPKGSGWITNIIYLVILVLTLGGGGEGFRRWRKKKNGTPVKE